MTEADAATDLLPLLKALADRTRLGIVGLLAQRPHSVEELALKLGRGASTISHHLSVLSGSGLVSGKVRGYYNMYSLHCEPLQEMARNFLGRGEIRAFAGSGEDAFDRKVLAAFTLPDGRIRAIPVQEKKFQVLLRHVLREFEPGVRYTEKRVNEILSRFHEDTARFRRSVVEYRYMAREGGGGKYWRIEPAGGG